MNLLTDLTDRAQALGDLRAFAAMTVPVTPQPKPAPPYWQNWVMLNAAGDAVWILYATSREDALSAYPRAADARPQTAADAALALTVDASWGRLD